MIKRTSFSLIHYAFSVLIVCIAFATIVVDKNIDSAFPNTVGLSQRCVLFDRSGCFLGDSVFTKEIHAC